jgi:hypothetical protein
MAVARRRRPLTPAEKESPCPRCGAGPGERCKNPGGIYYGQYAHAGRTRVAATGAEYRVTCCRNCRHPGGQHVIDGGCRLCRECPGWLEGEMRTWSDRMTEDLLAGMASGASAQETEGP